MTVAVDDPSAGAEHEAELCRRLADRLPDTPAEDIHVAVEQAWGRLAGSRVEQYIPVLVERLVVEEPGR